MAAVGAAREAVEHRLGPGVARNLRGADLEGHAVRGRTVEIALGIGSEAVRADTAAVAAIEAKEEHLFSG